MNLNDKPDALAGISPGRRWVTLKKVSLYKRCVLYCLKRFWKKYLDVCTCHNSGAKEQSSMGQCIIWNKWGRKDLITLYTLSLVCIFSSLFSIHFFRCCQGEFVLQSRASLVGDHFLYSRGLNVWFSGCALRTNQMLVTPSPVPHVVTQ